jgi:hypothetical protein
VISSCTSVASDKSNITSITFDCNDEIKLIPGETRKLGYVFVSVKNSADFSENDVAFISEDTTVAAIEFDRRVLGTYLYYSITAIGPGQTHIYVISKDGTVSEKILVTVSDTHETGNSIPDSEPQETTKIPNEAETKIPESIHEEIIHTESVPQASEPLNTNINLVALSSPIGRNKTASVSIKGLPNTEYEISVFYSSSESSASGLENKFSDDNGIVKWEWKIGGKTAPGEYKIVISGGNESATFYFTVE